MRESGEALVERPGVTAGMKVLDLRPTMNAFEAATADGRAADLQAELETLFDRHNESSNGNVAAIVAGFMCVTVQV